MSINATKVLRRIARIGGDPTLLERVARDLGVGLAAGQRDELAAVARQLAAHAPMPGARRRGASTEAGPSEPPGDYWAGFSAALGMLLASWEAAHQHVDMRAAARRAVTSPLTQAVVRTLATGPATGAELAAQLGATPGATSKILASLRSAGLARPVGAPEAERGARKPHVLTPLGSTLADELGTTAASNRRAATG